MLQTESLISDYINFSDQNGGLSASEQASKELTFCAAAAVSHLCNDQEQGANVHENLLQSDRFRFIRDLDIISSIYAIAPISKKAGIKSTPPVLAWSNRLQTVFLGFCCTRDMNDVRSDLDVRLASPEGIGSRFHSGFWNRSEEFVPLVEWLMQRHKVVVCGHSFGGALATISSYLAMVSHDPVPNAWEEKGRGISIITFGAPSCMVAEPQGTTAALQMDLSSNFHHVINPHDYVPFALNDSSRKFKQGFDALKTPLGKISPTIQMLWPIFEYFLDLLMKNTGNFCHFGCMYSIAAEAGLQNCLQTLRAHDLPQIPNAGQVEQYHKMSHYFYCVKNSVSSRLTPDSSSEISRGVASDAVPSVILPMPETVTHCSCVVHSDRLIVSVNVDNPIVQYLLKGATFKKDTLEIPLRILGFPMKPADRYQASVELEYRIQSGDTFNDIGKASIAIQKGITLHDIFDRSTDIEVNTVRSMSLDRASLPATFESVRLAMVRALVAQMSRVQALRTENVSRDTHSPEQIVAIDPKIRPVVECIDSLVSNASPHLVLNRLGHAFTILKTLWPKDFEFGSEFQISMPGAYGDDDSDTSLLHDIPADCPRALRRVLTDMLLSQSNPSITRAQLSVKHWEDAKSPTVTKQFAKVPTFAGAVETFSHDLYHRSTDPSRRTEQSISQFQDVMGVIQLCHLIIITQLDAPYEWYCKSTEGHQITSAALGALPSYWSGASVFSRVLASSFMEGWSLSVLSAGKGVTGGLAMLFASTMAINHFLNRHKEYLNLSFPGALAVTLQALGLPPAESDDIVEKTLLDRVKQDISSCGTLQTLEKWRVKLEEGMKDYPGAKANQWYITPTYFWPQWLFNVARVAQLRIQLSDKICIGVQGSTEAGKSQMLTVLTGASEDYFKPGSSSLCRTLGIQSYDSSSLSAIFLDSPGFDDQRPEIKYMADVFQELFAIVIIVIPMERTRSEATESALRIAIKLLNDREDTRPLRILLSQADGLDHHRNNKEVFRHTLRDVKDQFMSKFRHELGEDFTTFRQQPFRDGIVCKSEKLEDIVKPFSTHAQMSLDGICALADCPPGTPCKIERASHFENLCELADTGEIWDIESLRAWLRDLSPNSVPMSNGRVREYCD